MESQRYKKAQNRGVLLAISRQLLQRGLINQSEYEHLQQVLEETYGIKISHAEDSPAAPERQIQKKGEYRETE